MKNKEKSLCDYSDSDHQTHKSKKKKEMERESSDNEAEIERVNETFTTVYNKIIMSDKCLMMNISIR